MADRGCIVRIATAGQRTKGWQARWSTRRGRLPWRQLADGSPAPYRSQLFSDRKCGGTKRALEAARRWIRAQGRRRG